MDDYLRKYLGIGDAVMGCVLFWQQNHLSQPNDENVSLLSMQGGTSNEIPIDGSLGALSNGQLFLHPQCSVIQVASNNNENHSSSTSYTTSNGSLYTLPPALTFEIVTMRHFDTFTKADRYTSQTLAAAVQIKTKKFHPQQSRMSGFLVFLLDRSSQWRCISAAFAVSSADVEHCHSKHLVYPSDMKDVMSCVCDKYCTANRACNGNKMAEVFHESCRLTYVDVSTHRVNADDGDDGIRVWDCQSFCQIVTNRYTSEPPHIPYAHFKDDPLAASGDELLGVEFAECTPSVAMVTLKVGHPPFLWTDLLSCAKLGNQWYIVHKSSTSEPFLTHLSHKTTDES